MKTELTGQQGEGQSGCGCPHTPHSPANAPPVKPTKPTIRLLRNVDWVYLDPTAKEFICRRCRDRRPFERATDSGPIDAENVLSQMRAFQESHSNCVETHHNKR
jgi:hypothetical protein